MDITNLLGSVIVALSSIGTIFLMNRSDRTKIQIENKNFHDREEFSNLVEQYSRLTDTVTYFFMFDKNISIQDVDKFIDSKNTDVLKVVSMFQIFSQNSEKIDIVMRRIIEAYMDVKNATFLHEVQNKTDYDTEFMNKYNILVGEWQNVRKLIGDELINRKQELDSIEV